MEIELFHDVLSMSLDRLRAHVEVECDLLRVLAFCDELEDLALAVGELGSRSELLVLKLANIVLHDDARDS